MKLLQVLGLWFAFGAGTFVDPAYPPNTISGGTVIAELHVDDGQVKQVSVRSGDEPFLRAATNALAQWKLPAEDHGNQLVIVHFRQPNLYYLDGSDESIASVDSAPGLPYPRRIVGPSYPAQGVGLGSVVLKLKISAEGKVEKVETLKSAGSLTDVSINAVRKWDFVPAENNRGVAEPSYAYAVLVYQMPVIAPKK